MCLWQPDIRMLPELCRAPNYCCSCFPLYPFPFPLVITSFWPIPEGNLKSWHAPERQRDEMVEGREGQWRRFIILLIDFAHPISTGVSFHSALQKLGRGRKIDRKDQREWLLTERAWQVAKWLMVLGLGNRQWPQEGRTVLTGLRVMLRIYKLWCEGETLWILKKMLGIGLIGGAQGGYLDLDQIICAFIYKVHVGKTGEPNWRNGLMPDNFSVLSGLDTLWWQSGGGGGWLALEADGYSHCQSSWQELNQLLAIRI